MYSLLSKAYHSVYIYSEITTKYATKILIIQFETHLVRYLASICTSFIAAQIIMQVYLQFSSKKGIISLHILLSFSISISIFLNLV